MEVPFDLVVRLHVREHVDAIDNLNLPMLSDLEVLGDERRYQADQGGTSYTEIVRVVAHHTGRIDVAPATLDAIDALDGKAKRYSTNPLSLAVGGGALIPQRSGADAVNRMFGAFLTTLLVVGGILVLLIVGIGVLVVVLSRRSAPPPVVVAPIAVPVVPQLTTAQIVAQAAAELGQEPTRAGAVRARATVRAAVGAGVTETLGDVLRRPAASGPVATVLRALERAAFTYDNDLAAAIADAITAMEHL